MRKIRNTHYRTGNMLRKLTNEENKKIMVGPGIWRETFKNVKNEKHTLQDLQNGRKQKKVKKEKCKLQDMEYGEKIEKRPK